MTPATRTKDRKRAAGYLRVSKAREGMEAPNIYRSQIESYAKAFGWRIVEVFADLDYSGRKGAKPRPAFTQMMERRAEFDVIIVPKLSRFGRSLRDNLDSYDLLEASGVDLVALDLGIDTSTSGGKLMRNVLTALAEYESDLIAERWRDTHQYLAREGRHLGGVTVPFGYRYDVERKALLQDPRQARIVRELFRRYAAGWGLRQLARDLNERAVIGKRGRRVWTNGGIAKILDNPTYAGWRHYNGERTQGNWKPLIDRGLFDEVQARRRATKAPNRKLNAKGKGRAVLSGLLVCSCGAPMYRSTTSNARRSTYECSLSARRKAARGGEQGTCRAGGIAAVRTEQFVLGRFLERVSRPYAELVDRAPATVVGVRADTDLGADVDQQLRDVDRRLAKLVTMQLDSPGPATDAAFRFEAEALEAQREELLAEQARRQTAIGSTRRRAEQLEALRSKLKDLPRIWEAADPQERNEMLRLAIERLEVLPGRARLKEVGITWAPWLRESENAA